MNRVQKLMTSVAVVALMAGAGAAVYAQAPAGPGGRGRSAFGPGRGFGAGFALGQLDLSAAQKQQVRDITQRHRQTMQPVMQRMEQAMMAEHTAVDAMPVNEAAVRGAAQDVAAAQADLAVDQARMHSDIFSILTVEQQTKAKELEAQAQARQNERRQRAGKAPKGQV
jgi:Spy/CpxP family protein refolding chaperone